MQAGGLLQDHEIRRALPHAAGSGRPKPCFDQHGRQVERQAGRCRPPAAPIVTATDASSMHVVARESSRRPGFDVMGSARVSSAARGRKARRRRAGRPGCGRQTECAISGPPFRCGRLRAPSSSDGPTAPTRRPPRGPTLVAPSSRRRSGSSSSRVIVCVIAERSLRIEREARVAPRARAVNPWHSRPPASRRPSPRRPAARIPRRETAAPERSPHCTESPGPRRARTPSR